MSVATEITRIRNSKERLKEILIEKGATLTGNEKLDELVEMTTNIGGDTTQEDGLIEGTLTSYRNDRVTRVTAFMFHDDANLESIDLPNVTEIGAYAFRQCLKLTNVNIPNVTSMDYGAFSICRKLTSIVLPKLMYIESEVFLDCGLTDIYLGANQVVTLDDTLQFSNTGIKVHVRSEYADQYTTATNWSSLIADGSIVIVGDYENYVTISTFKIYQHDAGSSFEYNYEVGMTWKDWFESKYRQMDFIAANYMSIDEKTVYFGSPSGDAIVTKVLNDLSTKVKPTDLIEDYHYQTC